MHMTMCLPPLERVPQQLPWFLNRSPITIRSCLGAPLCTARCSVLLNSTMSMHVCACCVSSVQTVACPFAAVDSLLTDEYLRDHATSSSRPGQLLEPAAIKDRAVAAMTAINPAPAKCDLNDHVLALTAAIC